MLGAVPPRQSLTVDWTFTNSGSEIWPVGCRLRSVAGNLAATGIAKVSDVATPPGGHLTLQATMVAPSEPGPCEAQWQLESPDGAPLSPPMTVKGMVLSAASGKPVLSALPSKPISQTPAKTIPAAAASGDASLQQQRAPETPIRMVPSALGSGLSSQAGPGAVSSGISSQTGQVSMARTLQPSHTSAHSAQPILQRSLTSGTERWLQLFESFFGKEVAVNVHQPGGKERMVNQVWEYVRSKQLLRVQDNAYVFDPLLQQLFAPIMQPGASHCPAGDLLPSVHRLLARFVDCQTSASRIH